MVARYERLDDGVDEGATEGVRHHFGNSGHHDTPTGAGDGVDVIDLEREHCSVSSCREARVRCRAQNDRIVQHREGHRYHRWQGPDTEHHSTDQSRRQEPHGLLSGEILEGSLRCGHHAF